MRYEAETKSYYLANNQPLTTRDIAKIVEYTREYNLICELLVTKRGDVRALIYDGLPKDDLDLLKQQEVIERGIEELEDVFGEGEPLKNGLKAMAQFYSNSGGKFAVIHQVHIKEAIELLDQIKSELEMLANPAMLCYDETNGTFYLPASRISHWWHRQAPTEIGRKISIELKQKLTGQLVDLINVLAQHPHLTRWEMAELTARIEAVEGEVLNCYEKMAWASPQGGSLFASPFTGDMEGLVQTTRALYQDVAAILASIRGQIRAGFSLHHHGNHRS